MWKWIAAAVAVLLLLCMVFARLYFRQRRKTKELEKELEKAEKLAARKEEIRNETEAKKDILHRGDGGDNFSASLDILRGLTGDK